MSIKKQAGIKILRKISSKKIELVLTGGIFPKKKIMSLCQFSIFSNFGKEKLSLSKLKIFRINTGLIQENIEDINIIQTIQIYDEVEEIGKKGKTRKRAPFRSNAIEEYFTLVGVI